MPRYYDRLAQSATDHTATNCVTPIHMTVTAFVSTNNSLATAAVRVCVYRCTNDIYEILSDVVVTSVQVREGANPSIARFRYNFDSSSYLGQQLLFEQAIGVSAEGAKVVKNDDRLVVLVYTAEDCPIVIFDGFAQVPKLSVSESGDLVTFLAYGVEIREWDRPIGGALLQDLSGTSKDAKILDACPVYFNPRGEANAALASCEAIDAFGNTFPIFLDDQILRDPDVRTLWTLPKAIRYLCFHENGDQNYVLNPDGDEIDSLLDSRTPSNGIDYNPSILDSYRSASIDVPDYPATGKSWPEVVEDLIRPSGFGMAFRLETAMDGSPRTRLYLYRTRDSSPSIVKDLFLQERGARLDPLLSNVNRIELSRDTGNLANAYKVISHAVSYEASFILAPGFEVDAKDALSASSLASFDSSNCAPGSTGNDAYRLYVFDETGEGHWDWRVSLLLSSPTSLASLFDPGSNHLLVSASRRRIPSGTLFTRDSHQKALKARLSISTDYEGEEPGLWDGSGTWQTVSSGYNLLNDRLGIWITAANPNGWVIGPSSAAGAPYPAGVVRAIEDQASPARQRFTLRLTCVINSDNIISAYAKRRPASPTKYEILRTIDASDRYFKRVIAPYSEFNMTSKYIISRDDTADAQAEAAARRLASETGSMDGTVTIPRFTTTYQVGDRIRSIKGRGLSLQTNAGAPNTEGPVYPAVVGVLWEFDGKQQTSLFLSDQIGP